MQQQPGQRQGAQRGAGPGQQPVGGLQGLRPSGIDRAAGPGMPAGVITGAEFLEWSEDLRNVEEMLEDPALRAEAARIRDEARGIRTDLRQSFRGPNWDLVREFVAEPLNELRQRVGEELLRRGAREAAVPIDRDPVPPKYTEEVRRYYEQLGIGQ
jgi:hypothetical protein